jgi:pimeloyl-ACP methyl ester carboxylesterase
MGGNGPEMAATILPQARAQGWTVIAPTIPYGEWRDPAQLTGEELGLQPQLATLLDSVRAETGVAVGPRVLIFGFSRGAQSALRFAMLYPDHVQAVAACSAGTYTLPMTTMKTGAGATINVPLPFGVADLEQRAGRGLDAAGMSTVHFLIGVGAKDNREGDVPRQWDQFIGNNRVERAQRFAASISAMGMPAQVVVVPDTGHELSAGMMTQVSRFLNDSAADLQAQIAAATTSVPAVLPTGRARS